MAIGRVPGAGVAPAATESDGRSQLQEVESTTAVKERGKTETAAPPAGPETKAPGAGSVLRNSGHYRGGLLASNLHAQVAGRDDIDGASRVTVRDPARASWYAEPGNGARGIADSKKFLADKAGAIKAKLATLTPEERKAFARIDKALVNPLQGDDKVGADPVAGSEKFFQAELSRLLLDGRLQGKDLKGEKTLLQRLDQLATQPLADGVTRVRVLRELVEEMQNPLSITQGGKGVCAAASAGVMLAMKSPAEYAGLIADLASPAGKATLANGDTILREADWKDGALDQSFPSRLLWPGLMEYGNGEKWDYDFTKDEDILTKPDGTEDRSVRGGLEPPEMAKLAAGLMNRPYVSKFTEGMPSGQIFNEVKAATDKGDKVPVALRSQGGAHAVFIDRIDGDTVHYSNPHGQSESLSVADFLAGVQAYVLPT